MTKQGFEPSLIVKEIQSSATDFDTSPQALIDLKNATVDNSVMEAMLNAQSIKPTGTVEAVRSTTITTVDGVAVDPTIPTCTVSNGCLLREGTVLPLKFAADLNSKTANEGDTVEFLLDEDVKVGDSIVLAKGAHAVGDRLERQKSRHAGPPRRTQRAHRLRGRGQQPHSLTR